MASSAPKTISKLVSISPSKTAGPIVVCGPSGCGKSTLLKKVFERYPETFGFSVSHTTRSPRPGEQHGVHYYFVTRPEFEKLIDEGAFIEHAEFSNNRYGTTVRAVDAVQEQKGKRCVLDIDTQGVKIIHQNHLSLASRSLFIFLSPPGLQSLYTRLSSRGTETPQTLRSRLSAARGEMAFAREGKVFDAVVVNDDLEKAVESLRLLMAEGKVEEIGDELPDSWTDEDVETLLKQDGKIES